MLQHDSTSQTALVAHAAFDDRSLLQRQAPDVAMFLSDQVRRRGITIYKRGVAAAGRAGLPSLSFGTSLNEAPNPNREAVP